MRVTPIPCLSDNYAYLLVCPDTKEAAIVDASESGPVLSALKDGDPVLVVGRKDGSANDARRVFAPSPAQLAKLKAKAAQRAAQAAQQG